MREYIRLIESQQVPVLYHGTRKSQLATIMAEGLLPEKTKSSLKAVFLTDNVFIADSYRFMHIASDDWTILKIDVAQLEESNLGPDNFELADALADIDDEDRTWNECTWEESLEICNQVAYHGIIPPSAIQELS